MRVLVVEDEPYLAEAIRDGLRLEAIAADIAPDGDTALELLSTKKNLRLLQLPADYAGTSTEVKQISGGLLVQSVDTHFAPFEEWTLATGEPADAAKEVLAALKVKQFV